MDECKVGKFAVELQPPVAVDLDADVKESSALRAEPVVDPWEWKVQVLVTVAVVVDVQVAAADVVDDPTLVKFRTQRNSLMGLVQRLLHSTFIRTTRHAVLVTS